VEPSTEQLDEVVKEKAERLRVTEELLRALRDATPNGAILVDMKGNIAHCNRGTLKVHHYSSTSELIGKPSLILVAPKDRETVAAAIRSAAAGTGRRRWRYNLVTKDGVEFPAEVYTEFVRDPAGNPIGFVALSRDLTAQYQYEDQLKRFERMAAIGETAAIVGHDLRNPLQGIAGALYVLKQKRASTADAETRVMVGLIEGALDHADRIVKELLEYSREVHLDLAETTSGALTEAALIEMRIPENVKVKNLVRDTMALQVDVAKMRRVFINLISNAIDAMPDGGGLTIAETLSEGFIEIKFTDTGQGISEKAMQNLWKPLKTTKPQGIGLGLVICKGIVEAHGGSIRLESTSGTGSTFTVRLPVKKG